jgi:hypothetical protein
VVKLSKQDRQAVRTAAELEQKYSFGKQFAEVMGVATDARDKVTSFESALRSEMAEFVTSITRDTEKIVMSAMAAYTTTEDLNEYKNALKAELELWASGITGRVTTTEANVEKVDNDLQEKFNILSKYFTFNINGLEIGSTYTDENGEEKKSPNKVIIDNDDITISVKESPVLVLKADGSSVIPSLDVTTSLKVVGLNIDEDDTHINCGYVG